ncbi:MAG: N-6 DNA methylase [Salinivirgaceae bacterium]|nr:N-6 DNA methylase [Salinivirgaceae bacterium]
MRNLFDIFETLKINKENGLFITANERWQEECNFSSRIEKLLKEKLKPDAFFVFDNKPLILFYDSHKNKEKIHKALWNFNESPIIIFVDNESVEIFNGFRYLKEKSSLELFAGEDCLNDFNYFEIVSGKTWDKYQSWLKYESRVDYHLLKNIKAARDILISKNQLFPNVANAIIGKVIFVRYLIDRNIKIGFDSEKHWSNNDFCSLLSNRNNAIKFFKYLENKFNGDMFKLDDSEYLHINQDSLNTIISLLNEDDLGNGQQSLFKLYDFSIIPIEFISNVYESFIGESNQEKEGAYYTPLFLVDYILNETVKKYHENNQYEYNCKVLDPACGSGIFLVETLRKIIERYISLNPDIKEDSEEFKEVLRQLAIDNIFGIDKNLSAIQVAIFSIQLTLLDYQKPSSIETFTFPKLLNTNFFEADFFNTGHEYNKILRAQNIHYIIGNPPWKRGKGDDAQFINYLEIRKKREKELGFQKLPSISNNEIAQAFLLRVSDFEIKKEVALIATSKVLYNLNGKDFRGYFLDNFNLRQIFELAPVRHDVFDKSGAIAPAVVLFFKSALKENTDNNIIEHISLKPSKFFKMFKVFSLSRSDYKKVEQKKLKEHDWLLKTLVYGSYLDFNLLIRLKKDYKTIGDVTNDESSYLKGQGVTIGGKDENDATHLVGKPFLKTDKNNIQAYWVNQSLNDCWSKIKIHRPRNKDLFSAPMLLLKKGLSNEFRMTSAVCSQDVVFTDSLTAIKTYQEENIYRLKIMSSILNSSLFSYYALNSFSSAGIEREQVHDEKWEIPFIDSKKLSDKVYELEDLINKAKADCFVSVVGARHRVIQKQKDELDILVLDSFNFTDKEKSLLDYANKVVIPIQMGHNASIEHFKSFEFEDNELENYAELFLKRFSKSLSTDTHQFIVEIWHSKQIVGMFFKVVSKSENQDAVVWIDKSKEDLLKMAIKLSSQKITDKLFVQKDLRGFEKDHFYIFKPNEKRLWHAAIGYQDVDEFMDAILKTGRRKYAGE